MEERGGVLGDVGAKKVGTGGGAENIGISRVWGPGREPEIADMGAGWGWRMVDDANEMMRRLDVGKSPARARKNPA